jgi:hypothetical protein
MMVIHVPDKLSGKINEMAEQVCQTPEEYILEIIAERIEYDSAYRETAYLAKSEANRKRLDEAVREIRSGFGIVGIEKSGKGCLRHRHPKEIKRGDSHGTYDPCSGIASQ